MPHVKELADSDPDLLTWKPSPLGRYDSQLLLDSGLARDTFLWPDLIRI